VLLFVFGKSFAAICLKIKLSNIIYTSIIKLYAVYFRIRDNQRYSKASYISPLNKSWLYHGLSHVQRWYSHCYKRITFLTVCHRGENVGQKQLTIFHGL